MAARAYWTGQIRLALVSIPVEIYSATKSGAAIQFHQIHEPSGKRINYEKVVQGIGPVDRDEIVKGFEVSKPAISKHLKVLEETGVLRREVIGRSHRLSLEPDVLSEAADWMDRQRALWWLLFDVVDEYLKEEQE